MRTLLACALALPLLSLPACRTPSPAVTVDVPFLPQPPNQCGPVALLMVARHYGLDPDPDALRAAAYIPALDGTTPEVLLHAAQSIGFPDARLHPLDPSNPQPLIDAIDSGIPPILFLAPPDGAADPSRGHFLVVVGYQPATGTLLVHSGSRPSHPLSPARYRSRLRTALLLPSPAPPSPRAASPLPQADALFSFP